jgi:hypothetical protein
MNPTELKEIPNDEAPPQWLQIALTAASAQAETTPSPEISRTDDSGHSLGFV